MPKVVKHEVTIELTCSLCPKTPTFSDISHLLTHISSKSHLSHRFKLQIRAQSESEAKEKLDSFDYWYHDNNLDALLADRLAAKEQKKTTKERKSRVSNASNTSKTSTAKMEQKIEDKPSQEALAATPVFRAPIPRMHLWSIAHISSPTPARDWHQNNMYSTPTMRRQVPNFAPAEAETPSGDMIDSKSGTPWQPDGLDEAAEADEGKPKKKLEKKLSNSSTTLKGVLWPGMDLFDSATPEMKRMRNQRKEDSVLAQMMATSNVVEANEVVYHLNGEIHHTRDIFGPLSTENSPNQIQDPTPKKRKTRKTAALSNISVNAPRLRAPRLRKNAVAETPLKRSSANIANLGPPAQPFSKGSTPNPLALANFGHRYVPTLEEDEEFRMTVGDMTKKRALSIFQDAPEVSPGRTESTLEDHRFDFSSDRTTGQPSGMEASDHISPTPVAKQPMRGFGKENGSSGFSPAIRARQHSAPSASHIYPGQLFYDPILNPLYDPSFARSFPSYVGQQTGYNESLKPPRPRFHSALHGHYRPIHPTQHPSGQQDYAAGPSNNGLSMN